MIITKAILPIVPILLYDNNFESVELNFTPNTNPTMAKIIVKNKTPLNNIAKSISDVKRALDINTNDIQIAIIKILNDLGFFAMINYSIFFASFQNTSISAKEQSAKALPCAKIFCSI